MAYSHSRLRKSLALVRIVTGVAFVMLGAFKVSSLEFGKSVFPNFLDGALRGGAAEVLQPLLQWVLHYGPTRIAVLIGFVELFIGVALVLGLAVRPACAAGMVYMGFAWLAAWNPAEHAGTDLLQCGEYQFRHLFPLLTFLVLGVGHAGETWGVGALYHRHRARVWARQQEEAAAAQAERVHEPASFEEFAEAEQRQIASQVDEVEEDIPAEREL